ncbi:hypothetical protein LCGC14_0953890 [marine sediment metagenome]|uniref:Uncharacterized protein n=1 Tax=marine sediment metagenome TaxID=412755 RepID=A0A0F9NL15_9ZZZZ
MKKLNDWNLDGHSEANYIKRFVNGVSEKELTEMFRKPLMMEGLVSMLMASNCIK